MHSHDSFKFVSRALEFNNNYNPYKWGSLLIIAYWSIDVTMFWYSMKYFSTIIYYHCNRFPASTAYFFECLVTNHFKSWQIAFVNRYSINEQLLRHTIFTVNVLWRKQWLFDICDYDNLMASIRRKKISHFRNTILKGLTPLIKWFNITYYIV